MEVGEWAMSQDEVSKEIGKAKRFTKLIVCARKCLEGDGCFDRGYVVDASDRHVLLHLVTDDIRLGGYVILRIEDISEVRTDFDEHHFIEKALNLRRMAPERPVLVDLNSIESILGSIAEHYSLMVVHREALNQPERLIGEVESICDKTFNLREIDREAKWVGTKRVRFDEVTRIEFDGGYETAIAQVAGLD
jgi:hypothetical protein